MRVIGVDPGARGALAFLQLDGSRPVDLTVLDMPMLVIAGRRHLDEYALARAIQARLDPPITAAIIEQGGVRPGNGKIGVAAFWTGLGAVRGVMAAHDIPIEKAAPAAWKKAMRLEGADKDASRLRASQLMPRWARLWQNKQDHGRAEAALIALYGAGRLPVREVA